MSLADDEELDVVEIDTNESSIKSHNFTICRDKDGRVEMYQVDVVQQRDSFMLWIGDGRCQFNTLAVAMYTKYDKIPACLNLYGDNSNEISRNISKKLATKTKKQVYVSYNCKEDDDLVAFIEAELFQKIKSNPELF